MMVNKRIGSTRTTLRFKVLKKTPIIIEARGRYLLSVGLKTLN